VKYQVLLILFVGLLFKLLNWVKKKVATQVPSDQFAKLTLQSKNVLDMKKER